MITNHHLTKGLTIRLANGWQAELCDNATRQSTRLCRVFGLVTEMGSVYTRDIKEVKVGGQWHPVRMVPTLAEAKAQAQSLGMTLSKRDGEYRIAPSSAKWGLSPQRVEAMAYYTDDIFDALASAQSMQQQLGA